METTTPLDRLKVLINSSTPIVVMETVEELRAVSLVRRACSDINMAVFEWTIADGLVRSGSEVPAAPAIQMREKMDGGSKTAIYNSVDPVQALANLEAMTIEAVFILKDFHRHMDSPVVIQRLRDVGQRFSLNRRTLVLTGPSIEMPAELASLVEFLDLPLPDQQRLREIILETYQRLSGSHTLKLLLDANGVDAMAANLRGLTEEEADRAISQALVARLALSPDCITDVLEAKKAQLKRSQMLEFVDAKANLAGVGGLENLKSWLRQRQGAWDPRAA
jgi:hypothetical protein